jgi:hypothetical protein
MTDLLLVWCPECRVWKALEEGKEGPHRPALVTVRDGAAYWYRDHPEPCDACVPRPGPLKDAD